MRRVNSNTLGFLGLLRRAGKITIGCDPVCDSMEKGKAAVILMAEDISANTKKTVQKRAKAYSPHNAEPAPHIYIIKCSKDELTRAVGKTAAVISVDDEKAAAAVVQKLADDKEECHYDDKI